MPKHKLGCFIPAVALAFTPFLVAAQVAKEEQKNTVTLDFVDSPLQDVARTLSLAYDTPILVDGSLNPKVTFHLEGLGLLEGLSALCEGFGLQVVQEGKLLKIRPSVDRGEHYFVQNDSGVTVSLKNKDIREFVDEFAANTGLNILAAPEVSGKISGNLRNMEAEKAFRALLEAHSFKVWKNRDCLRVGPREDVGKSEEGVKIFQSEKGYSANWSGVPLEKVLLELSAEGKFNLAVYGELQENVHLKFENMSLETLVESLFRGSRYTYVFDSSGLFVAERGAKNALSSTLLYPLKHISSEKALQQLLKIPPSPNFLATEVKEQNGLLLSGSAEEIKKAQELLTQIDMATLQVTLSCIIVEFKKGKSFELGLHSGSQRKTGEFDIGARGFFDFRNKNWTKSGAFGKIGVLPDRFEMELASMEENNEAKVLARPSLTTLNGNKAEMNVTNTVYYLVSQVTSDGYPITDYRSFNDGISLELTPSVTQQGSITLEVSPEIKTAGRSSGDGPRDISTRNLKTMVVLKSGETLCLGGLVRKTTSKVRSAVPFLGSIPLIGKLFSYDSEEEEESELAIFITPSL
ncbi:MAG: type II and III secretion system protein [Fibrobacteraceae bacterium]|nr:type II and III secretion system protein [Fibrobacteraceae bacterium]